MHSVNDQLKTTLAKVDQLKKRRKAQQERRVREARRKMDIRRNIIIGALVCKYFPEMMECQPKGSAADIIKEFAVFENILRILAANEGLLSKLKADAAKLM